MVTPAKLSYCSVAEKIELVSSSEHIHFVKKPAEASSAYKMSVPGVPQDASVAGTDIPGLVRLTKASGFVNLFLPCHTSGHFRYDHPCPCLFMLHILSMFCAILAPSRR